ncbi:DUF7224 domain-containing protein [Cutibacterium namnetense]|uniref:DUF7224 domain-containing protein n=1 Tax=Cutibacterium namnetense TaxID=1574624 RepID=A0ABX9IAR4_9ACTN|nr:hypothetical protein [Cutibacterium namnetense]REB69335.1 hypothetical protein CP880_07865 [Cutibacterium namnetense]
MRFTTRLRTAPGIWLAPLIAVVFIMVDQNASSGSYWLPLVVGDTARVMVANGLCAFAGALEGRRLKTVALTSNRVRAWWRILLGPVVASASVTTVLTVIFVARHGFASHPLGWAVLGVTLLSVWSWTIAGVALGLWLPVAVAAPLALAVPVAWMIFPPGMSIYWLRHLTVTWLSCCTITQTLNPVVITGTLAVQLGLLAGGVIVASARVARHGRRLSLCLGVLALSMGFVAGAVQVGHLDAFPTIARETVVRCRAVEGTGVQVCLLPEHESERSMLDSAAKRVFPMWRRAGIDLPRWYSEQPLPGRKDAVELSVFSGMMGESIATARLAAATGRPFCSISDEEEARPVEIIQYGGRIDAWLRQVARAAGLEVTEEGVASEDSAWAKKLRTKDAAAQASVVRKMQEYLRGCPR